LNINEVSDLNSISISQLQWKINVHPYYLLKTEKNMEQIEKIEINETSIKSFIEVFLENSKPNQFYDKNVFFTQKLRCSKYNQFQVIGNLGGLPIDSDFSSDTDFYIISDFIFEELKRGNIDSQIIELEKKINSKGKKHAKLKVLTEKVFIEHIHERCLNINDQVTLNLIRELI
jgi:hypothetical protein